MSVAATMKTEIFSEEEIERIARAAFDGQEVQVLSHHLERFSEDKVGFLGTHQSLEMAIKRHGKSAPETCRFFVKSLPSSTEEQSKLIRERNLFGREALYFNDILPLLKNSCPLVDDWSPKCLLANEQLLVLEDMRRRSYAMSDTKMLSDEQLVAAFQAQARLHAASLVAEKRLGRPLNEAYPNSSGDAIFNEDMLKHKRLDLYTDLAEKVAESLRRDSRRLRAGLRGGFDQMYDQSRLPSALPKVIEHGDAWPNNYLFDASEPPKCVLVDYQLIRYGPAMYDSAMLAYLGADRQLRERALGRALEAYHGELCGVLQKNAPEVARPTLQSVLGEYEELRATALLCALMYYPVIWLDKSTVDKYGERERYEKLMFRRDNSFVMQIYDEDQVFAARINDVVQEAVEYFEKRGVPVEERGAFH